MRCEMEQERVIRVEWKQPFPHPSSHQPHPQPRHPSSENKPVLGPTIIPTVSSPVPFGAYLSDAEKFRHIDSSGSTLTGTSRAGLAEAESLGDEEMIRETAIPVHIEPLPQGFNNQSKDVEAQTQQQQQQQQSAAAAKETTDVPQPRPRQDARQRRKVNKCPIILGCLLSLAVLAVIAIIIAWAVLSNGFQNVKMPRFSNVCSNKDCIEIAAGLTRSLDDKIPVCENFYRHTCGNFHFENPSNPNELTNYKTRLDEGLENEIHDFLTAQSTQPSFSLQFSKSLYSQCTDFPLRESVGAEPLLSLLRNLPCGPLFPGCNGFNGNAFSWERSSGMMDLYAGDLNVVVFDKDTNSQNPQEIILSFKAPDFSKLLDDSKLKINSLQPTLATEFQALLSVQLKGAIINSSVTQLFGFRWDRNQQGQLEELIQLVVNLDELATISKQNNELPIILTLQEFSNMIAPIDLRSIFDAGLSAAHSWQWTDTVLVQNPFYYQNLSQIISNTSKRAIANYLTLAAVFNLRPYLEIRGDSADSEDWRKCLKQMSTLDPLANVYASNRAFDYNGFTAFFSDLKNFFIAYNPQLSPNTLSTIRRTDIKVGAPIKIFDDAGLQTAFSTIRIQDDSFEQRKSQNMIPWQFDNQNSDYFTTILAALKQQRMIELGRIGTLISPGDSVRWPSLETDFIFNQIENELIIPMGLFQTPPLTIPSTPTPLSSVLATTGLIFYKKLYEISSTLEMQVPLKPCVQELFGQFVPPETFIPSNYTKNADEYSSAMELILRKYREWKQRERVQHVQTLPSFDSYSDEQLMFLQFGTLMCSSAGENIGSLHEAMINTAVTLVPGFASTFNCPSNSLMTPAVTCNLPTPPPFISSTTSMPPPFSQ